MSASKTPTEYSIEDGSEDLRAEFDAEFDWTGDEATAPSTFDCAHTWDCATSLSRTVDNCCSIL